MTTVSKNAAPVKTHRSKAKAEATRRGLLYALPDWLMIIMLFFVPIVARHHGRFPLVVDGR